MSTFTRVIYLGALVSVMMGMAACADRDRDTYHSNTPETYRYENGDRIDSQGHRDVHWCADHPDDVHCPH